MQVTLKVTGMAALEAAIKERQRALQPACERALASSMNLVIAAAQNNLDEKVYDVDRNRDPERPLTGNLREAFVPEVEQRAAKSAVGIVSNTDEAAWYLEKGTPEHVILPSAADALRFWDPTASLDSDESGRAEAGGGAHIFRHSVEVAGIEPMMFLEDAVVLNEAEIVEQFEVAVKEAME